MSDKGKRYNEEQMLTTSVSVEQFESSHDAPSYGKDNTLLKLDKAVIVRNGTQAGKSTVDLQFFDQYGKKHVALITGRIIRAVAQSIGDEG